MHCRLFSFIFMGEGWQAGAKKKGQPRSHHKAKKNHPLTWAQGVARRKTPELGKRGGATKNPRAGRKGVAWRKTPALFLGGGARRQQPKVKVSARAATWGGLGGLWQGKLGRENTHTDLGKKTQVVKKK